MSVTFQAEFSNGVLKPLDTQLNLKDHERVTLTLQREAPPPRTVTWAELQQILQPAWDALGDENLNASETLQELREDRV